jgi:hypothetical protein
MQKIYCVDATFNKASQTTSKNVKSGFLQSVEVAPHTILLYEKSVRLASQTGLSNKSALLNSES